MIEERGSGGVLQATYTYGSGIDENLTMNRGGQTYYYFHDGLGSVTDLTKSTGELVESYSYDAYGQPTTSSTVGNPYLFTGREYDSETGLYHYRARAYHPGIGRFLQRDPQPGRLDDPGMFVNKYAYVANSPLNWVDPFGWDKQKPWWEKLEEGYYYGTGHGQDALDWYVQKWAETGQWYYALGGGVASLWTPQTYQNTAWTLIGGKSFVFKGSIKEPIHYGFDILGRNIVHYGRHIKWGRHFGIGFNKKGKALFHIYRNRIFWSW